MSQTDMTPEHHARLRAAGVDAAALDAMTYRRVVDDLPQWWHDSGNALYLSKRAALPQRVMETLVMFPVSDVLIVIGSDLQWLTSLLVGGDRAVIFIGRDCAITAGELYCGGDSRIILQGRVVGTRSAIIDARNGGSVIADVDQLWASGVYIATDDMHRLEDAHTGERINPFGAHIRLGTHVWLCRDAVLTGHVEIGDGSVVGMRSMVRGQKIPANSVVAGSPARTVREGVTWRPDDVP